MGHLTVAELAQAEIFLLKKVQEEEFSSELKCLSKGETVAPNSKLKCLNPFLDRYGVLRVHGRVRYANISFNSKFPIILPKGHNLTEFILESYHKRYFHLGPTAMLHYIRQKFWPFPGKTTCRKIVHDCIKCFKVKPVGVEQLING